jgi:iron complex outermembrane receptor protein
MPMHRYLHAALLASSIMLPTAAQAQLQPKQFDIPAQNLGDALRQFGVQAARPIIFDESGVTGRTNPALKGRYTVDQALALLIAGSGLRASTGARGVIILKSAAAQTGASRPVARMESPQRQVDAGAVTASSQTSAASSPPVDDIVVTARRRDETSISTPVTLSAIGQAQLQGQAIASLDQIARVVPQLIVGNSQSVQGGSITLRGIGSSESNPFADQAVSFSVDGVQIARATVQRMAQMDLAQVAVYKGPQALFFGKNSPAGVVDIQTADPTPRFDSQGSAAYDAEGREWRGEAFVSGPLTDTLGARMAIYGSHMDGNTRNVTLADPVLGQLRRRAIRDREFAGRLTLKFAPASDFSARFKLSYNRLRTGGPTENQQLIDCPTGSAQLSPGDDCRLNFAVVHPNLGPRFAVIDPRYGDGVPFLTQRQWLTSLELDYALSDQFKLTSTTGFYRSSTKYRDTLNSATVRANLLANYQEFKDTEFSEEVRLASDLDGPVNFLLGAFYQHSKLYDVFIAARNADAPVVVANYNNAATQKADAFSGFAQVSWNITPTLELSGGGRYSHERKKLAGEIFYLPVRTAVPSRSFSDFSPEATITWRPTGETTLYGSYKRGFLSGGFNVSAVDLTADRSYGQQTIKGPEIGAKLALFDRTLRLNAALYDYDLKGLQVQSQVGITQVVTNAGKASVRGAEIDANWSTPVEGLSLTGAFSYNRARYDIYSASCYAGQTIAMGCNLNPSATGVFRAQDLKGRSLARAPEVIASAGLDYEKAVSAQLKARLNLKGTYTSSYYANPSLQAASRQEDYWLVDASFGIGSASGAWDVALIGRNLTNQLYIARANDVTFTGSGTGTAQGVLADVSAVPSRGRQIMLRLTIRPGEFGQ